MRIFVAILFCFATVAGFSQNSNCDSLEQSYLNSKGEQRIKYAIELLSSNKCTWDGSVIEHSIDLGRKLKLENHTFATLLVLGANGLSTKVSSDSVNFLFEEALPMINFELNEEVNFIYYRYRGLFESQNGEPEAGVDLLHKAMEHATNNNQPKEMARIYGDLAVPQYLIGNYESAIKHWKISATNFNLAGENKESYSSCMNISLAYSQIEELDSAQLYLQNALDITKTFKLTGDEFNLNNNIGILHYRKQEYLRAIEHFEISADIAFSKGHNADYGIAISNIASSYTEFGTPEKGIDYVLEALKICKKSDNVLFKVNMFGIASDTYSGLKDYENAWLYQDSAQKYNDSLQGVERAKNLAESEEKFQSVQKDVKLAENKATIANERLETAVHKQANDALNTIVIFVVIALIIVMALVLVAYRGYIQKKRSALALKDQNEIIEAKNKDILDSITYAKNLQESILPKASEIEKSIPNYMIYFQPRDIVSGDFYWFSENETHTYIAAADCTGHGVPGAFVSMMCYNELNRAVRELQLMEPGEILTAVSRNIITEFKNQHSRYQSNDGMDIALVSINKKTQQITYAGAMNSLVHIREQDLMEIKADRRSIGGGTDLNFEFETHQVDSIKDDVLYLFSDGYQDQFGGEKGKKFMSKNFKKLLLEINHLEGAEQALELEKQLVEWRGNYEQLDDILVLGFQVA
ncbi:MAG: serine phosphatase RsbU (regulator of sigma subunit) [Parvicellaceae bacterium]